MQRKASDYFSLRHRFQATRSDWSGDARSMEANWYYSPEFDMEGWLCPALFKYFDKAPRELYGRAEPKTG